MLSEASVEALGGAVGSIIAVAATYPLTTVSKEVTYLTLSMDIL